MKYMLHRGKRLTRLLQLINDGVSGSQSLRDQHGQRVRTVSGISAKLILKLDCSAADDGNQFRGCSTGLWVHNTIH
jgi:hypothetical protein